MPERDDVEVRAKVMQGRAEVVGGVVHYGGVMCPVTAVEYDETDGYTYVTFRVPRRTWEQKKMPWSYGTGVLKEGLCR